MDTTANNNTYTVVNTGATFGVTTAFGIVNGIAGATQLIAGTHYNVIYTDGTVPNTYTNPTLGAPLTTPVNQVQIQFLNQTVTPVTVDSFTAKPEGTGVLLAWNCVSEYQNAGFNVYRRTLDSSEWTKLNAGLICGRITNADSKLYSLYDWTVTGSYEYKLESLSIKGEYETYRNMAYAEVDGNSYELGLLSADGIDAAVNSLDEAANAVKTTALSAKFAQQVEAGIVELGAQTGIEKDVTQTRAVGTMGSAVLARNADGSLVKPALVKDLSQTSADGVAVASAVRSVPQVASATINPVAASRWFSNKPVSSSASFTGAKVVYSKPGVMLIPTASLPAGIDANHVALQREGRALSALALTQNGLLVYGKGYEDDYTLNDAIFLRPTAGATVVGQKTNATGLFGSTQPVNTESPSSVTVGYHDVYFDYSYAFRPYTFTPWFSSKYLSATADTGTTQTFAVATPNATSNAATLTVNAWSLTQTEGVTQDHALQVLVNGQPAGQAVWTGGNKMVQLTFQVPTGALLASGNQIDLVTPAIVGVKTQIAFLHSISVSYTRSLDGSQPVVVSNSGSTSQMYEMSNIQSENVWVVDTRFPDRAALVPYEAQVQGDGTYKIRFNASSGGTGQYQVVPVGMENAPLAVSKRQVKSLKLTGTYLAVGPSQFSAGVQPLIVQHAKEGIRGQFVDQEQLFDYYNYGRYSPVGIQNAVRSTLPKYLLLVGRTTYDYKNYTGLNVDPLCPAFLVSTSFWAQATSDSMFGDLGRGYSEVAIGRLPVNNVTELSVAVKHILNYQGAPVSGVRVHAVADVADPLVANFPAQAASLGQQFPDMSWQSNYLGVNYQTPQEVTASMTTAATGGADWIVYIGHGNAVGLGNGSPRILDTTSVQAWTQNVVFLQSTCTANWMVKNVNDYKSIAIQALTQPQGGISASIGTSTYMNSDVAVAFMAQLMKSADKSGVRWGEALMKTQQWSHAQGGSFFEDLNKTEQIFGDPAMKVFSGAKITTPNAGVKAPATPVTPSAPATGTF